MQPPHVAGPPEPLLDRRDLLVRAGAAGLALGGLGALISPARAAVPPLSVLRRELQGDLVARGASGYASGKLLYNTRFDGVSPVAIAYCETPTDVAKCIRWARRNGVAFTARSGGHSYAGYSTTPGLVVDVSRMAQVRAQGATATIGAGARLIDIDAGLWKKRRAIPGGSCPSVGIAGLALGGGVGFSSRLHGTTSDALVGLTLVDADGRVRVCTARENADLFWACRGGGGGNFGIVTSFTFRTYPVSSVTTFSVSWPWADAQRVVSAWQGWAPHAPDALFSVCTLTTGSGSPELHAEGQFFGSKEQLERLLRPLVGVGDPSDVSTATRPYLDAMLWWAGCSDGVPACHLPPVGNLGRATFKATSAYAQEPMSAVGIRTLIRWIDARQGQAGSGAAILDAYGGAINRVPAGATAFAHRDMLYSLQYGAYWSGASAAALRWVTGIRRAMNPFLSGSAYVNYIDPGLPDWASAYYGSNYRRLQSVKRRYDTSDVFRFRQSIRLPG